MKFKKMQITYLLIAIITLTSGCTDVVKNNTSNQSIDANLGNIFEKLELNSTSDFISPDLRDRYEVVAANPDAFEKSASKGRMKLMIMDKDIELELKEVTIPEGAVNVSLTNGPIVYASEIDANTSMFQGHVVNSTSSNAWFVISKNNGDINGQINTGNESFHIWNTGETYKEKTIWIIYLSQPQSDILTFAAIPEKTELNKGELTNITLILTNIGNNTLNTWPLYEYSGYDVSFQSIKDNIYATNKCPGPVLRLKVNEDLTELKPGQSISTITDSSCWILNPGDYRLTVTYHTGGSELITKPYWRGSIKSNEILIKVWES